MNKIRLLSICAFLAALFLAVFSSAAPAAACGSSGAPVLSTDKADYGPDETAAISGSGFTCGETYTLLVTAPDGTIYSADGSGANGPDVVSADGSGEFVLNYALTGELAGGPTSDGPSGYAGQAGTYTVEAYAAGGTVVATTTFTDASHLGLPVPAHLIVTHLGLEWVYASPCALNGCTFGIDVGHDGFGFATAAQWAMRPPASAFGTYGPTGLCAAPYFDHRWNHCDYRQPQGGFLGSAPRFGLPAGTTGLVPMISHWDTWLVRVGANNAPTADPGGPYIGDEGAVIPLDGTNSDDPDLDMLTYSWTVNSPLCSLTNANTATPDLTCTDNVDTFVTLAVDDGNGGTDSASIDVKVNNVAPTVTLSGPDSLNESQNVIRYTFSTYDPGDDEFSLTIDSCGGFFVDVVQNADGSGYIDCRFEDDQPTATPSDTVTVEIEITDDDGDPGSDTVDVTVFNVDPTITSISASAAAINEADSVTVSGAFTDPALGVASEVFNGSALWSDGVVTAVSVDSAAGTFSTSRTFPDDDPNTGTPSDNFTVDVTISDDDTGSDSATSAFVTVNNLNPSIDSFTMPLAPVDLNDAVAVSGSFSDEGTADTHTVEIAWGDASTSNAAVVQGAGSGTFTDSHTYSEGGVYTIIVTLTDDDTGAASETYQFVVVYDPDGGFVTGGGWIMSPTNAFPADPTLTGKASFGFVSKYKKGKITPDGNTEFHFKAGDINFHSNTYDWLVVAGHKAQFRGVGTINGAGEYSFMITATDEALTPSTDSDRFRIRIWNNDGGVLIYDNQNGDPIDAEAATDIGGGSIVIHERGKK